MGQGQENGEPGTGNREPGSQSKTAFSWQQRPRARPVALLAVCLGLVACRDPSPAERERGREGGASRQAEVELRYEHCARMTGSAPRLPAVRIAGALLEQRGFVLGPPGKAPAASPRITLAVLGDTRQALPATLASLDRLAARFRREGAAAIIVLGGIDPSFEGTRAVLLRLRDGSRGAAGLETAPALPVLALPGDRESRSGFVAAVEALGADGVDLSRVRAVETPGVSLVAVPGYHLAHQLLAKEQGCSYDGAEIAPIADLARLLPQPRLLVAHGPPRGSGAAAIDRAFGDENLGDPLLARLLLEGEISLGLFAHLHESAGRATTRDGRAVSEGEWSTSLLVNVGAADSVPHEDLAGRWSTGSAAIVELEAGRMRFRMVHP